MSCSSTTSSQISTAEIKNIIECLRYQQYRDTTKKNYYTIWKIFSNFFIKLDQKPMEWADRLTLFVGYLIENRHQSSTVKCYILAIKAVLKDCDIEVRQDQYLLSSLTRACRLCNDQVRTRLPIQKGLLGIILRQIDIKWPSQTYLAALYKAIFSTMYYGLLRISEIAGQHPILARDIHIGKNKSKFY